MTRDELVMLYFDGELDAAETERVRELLRTDPKARAALARYELVSGLTRESGLGAVDPGDVFSAVMGRVAADQKTKKQGARLSGKPSTTRAARRRPARALVSVACGLALAASFALLVSHARSPKPPAALASATEVAAPAGAISAREPEPPVQSVAIERIDFGSSQGAIFLVPGPEDRTVVVWTDDSAGWTVDDDADDKGPEVDL